MPKKPLSPRDASLLTLLAQVPSQGTETWENAVRENILLQLSADAREIGEAVVATSESTQDFSEDARVTAYEVKRWAEAIRQSKIERSN